jgi:hypothetical protein
MLDWRKSVELIFNALLAMFSASKLDAGFCPMAPTPQQFQETVSFGQGRDGKFNVPNSIQVASRLVDTRIAGSENGRTIGWLYLDEHAQEYVVLIANLSPDLYKAFQVPPSHLSRRSAYTDTVPQVPSVRLPQGIEIRSCSQRYSA